MKVLFCNKFNFEFSGTEVYLFDLMGLLKVHGHDTAIFSMSHPKNEPSPYASFFVPLADFNDTQLGILEKLRLSQRVIYYREARRRLRPLIHSFHPDLAHIRNIYHHLSPSILWEFKQNGIPTVYHLNDFKLVCPNYNLFSHGAVCERCLGGGFWNVVTEGCHRGTLAKGITLGIEAYLHKWLGTYQTCVSRFIAPSFFCKSKLVEAGFDGENIDVLYHFQNIPPESELDSKNDYVLYFGRISPEKGLKNLLLAFKRLPTIRLVVAGEGPQKPELEAWTRSQGMSNVLFVGALGRRDLYRMIRDSKFTVMPSLTYETLGKVILESYALGKAVIATRLGTRLELVSEGTTGFLYDPSNVEELADRIDYLAQHPDLANQMGQEGKKIVIQRHTQESHYESLQAIYEKVLGK